MAAADTVKFLERAPHALLKDSHNTLTTYGIEINEM